MQGFYFHHLFLLCIWLSVKVPQLGCDAVSISGQEDRAAANQCWQKCSLAVNVSRSTAKAFESPETCYNECLKKSQDNCSEFLDSKSFLPRTDVKIHLVERGPKFYYANISWKISSDITRNWTQGYLVLYALQIDPETYASLHCHRVLGMETSFTGFDIINENLTNYSVLYVMVFSLSQERADPKDDDWQSISFREATSSSTVRTSTTFQESTLPSTVRTGTTFQESTLPSTVRTGTTFQESTLPSTVRTGTTFQESTLPSTVRTGTTFQESTLPSTVRTDTTTQELSTSSSSLPTSAIVAMCVTVAFVVVAVVIWRRFVGKKTKEEDVSLLDLGLYQKGFKFDAFIIYSTTDETWVKEKLLSILEEKHNIKCCIHYRDFPPGVPFVENMAQSVYNSRKTIAVVSKNFLSSNYCNEELKMALHRLVERGDNSVIVLKLDDVEDSKLPIELQCRSYIDFTKATDTKTWEYKLVNSFIDERC